MAENSEKGMKSKDLIYVFLSLPISLIVWMMGKIFSTLTNSNDYTLTPLRSFLSSLFPFIMCIYGYKRQSINFSGAIFGILVALILTISSPVYLITLAAFFFSSSKATKYRQDFKKKIEKDFKIGGQRNWLQVLCNGGMAALLAVWHLTECGVGEKPIDFENDYVASWLGIGVMAAFSCCNGDTWASELGVLSRSDPVLITSLKRVPRGTNGGISSWGLFVSFLGGAFIGFFYLLATLIFVDNTSLQDSPTQFPIVLLGGIAGLLGSIIDSFLGATLQFSGQTPEGYIVEHPGERVTKISGTFKILNNHSVNLISSIITSVIISSIGHKFWNFFIQSNS